MRKEKEIELSSYIEELKTVRKELVERKPKFLSIESYNCLLNNGIIIPREKILKNKSNGNAAIILPVTRSNTTILTVQPRVHTKSTVGIALPAGYIDKNEDSLEAAKRELLEETGYTSECFRKLCSFYQDDGCSGAFNTGYLATNCYKIANQSLDKDEFIRYFECSIEEAYELLEKGVIEDVGSQLLLEKARQYIKK